MPPKKAARSEAAATAAEAQRQEITAWLAEHDTLLGLKETPLTVSQLFQQVVTKHTFTRNGQHSFDWSVFQKVLEARTSASPRWFIQLREEDLLLEPQGLEGTSVETFVIAEASEPTMAPAHYIVKEHWPNSDLEDNAPERVLSIKDQDMIWKPVTLDDGSNINTFVLMKKSNTASAPVAAAPSFGFGATAAAPVSFGFAAPTAQPAVAPINFGFGTAAPLAAAPTMTFGFGAAAPAAAAPMSFGFGAAPQAPAQKSSAEFDAAAVAKAAKPFKQLRPSDILFVLWSKSRVSTMLKELKSGSRIVQENVTIGDDGKSLKIVMQNDLKDDIDDTAHDLLLNKVFAKVDAEVRKVDKWLDDCPVYDEHLAPHLQKFRHKFLKEQAEDSTEFEKICEKYKKNIVRELEKMVAVRKELVKSESSAVEEIAELLKAHRIADKSTFRVLKYYPKNDVLPFRPFGKVSGISEVGEHVDVCEPPMYVFKNKLLGQ